ncbi:MAG: NTP transferase domain-containing protein [Bacteroidales bacterium]|nr:NTP transferase domain-containing protein [Bacteroidales bacterium]
MINFRKNMMQNNKTKKEFSVIILAAGKSSRMGIPKLSLKYDDNNIFIKHIINEYERFGCKEIVIVVNETGKNYLTENKIKFSDNVKIVINKHPEWHRFYSLKMGAKSLSKDSVVFVHNVDNPFVNHEVLNKLLISSHKADYIGPEFNGKGGHPVLLSEKIKNDVRSTKEDQLHFKEFLNQYPKRRVKVDDEKVLVNINTLEEYRKYFK